jgi:hypothetical protein
VLAVTPLEGLLNDDDTGNGANSHLIRQSGLNSADVYAPACPEKFERAGIVAKNGRAAQPKLAVGKPVARFCVALAMWIAPGLLLMRIDLHAVEEVVGANPLVHAPIATIAFAFALTYIVATGLLIAATASRLTEGRPIYVKTAFLLTIAPAILISLMSTLMSSFAFFLSLVIWCFPALL